MSGLLLEAKEAHYRACLEREKALQKKFSDAMDLRFKAQVELEELRQRLRKEGQIK